MGLIAGKSIGPKCKRRGLPWSTKCPMILKPPKEDHPTRSYYSIPGLSMIKVPWTHRVFKNTKFTIICTKNPTSSGPNTSETPLLRRARSERAADRTSRGDDDDVKRLQEP